MTDVERLRHSTAHVLATAIAKIWPEAQFAAGPPVENGFYYDVELNHRISTDDFEAIEKEMTTVVKENQKFERIGVSRDEALELAKNGRLAALGAREPHVTRRAGDEGRRSGAQVSRTTWHERGRRGPEH